jgi:hypothetical protein
MPCTLLKMQKSHAKLYMRSGGLFAHVCGDGGYPYTRRVVVVHLTVATLVL